MLICGLVRLGHIFGGGGFGVGVLSRVFGAWVAFQTPGLGNTETTLIGLWWVVSLVPRARPMHLIWARSLRDNSAPTGGVALVPVQAVGGEGVAAWA